MPFLCGCLVGASRHRSLTGPSSFQPASHMTGPPTPAPTRWRRSTGAASPGPTREQRSVQVAVEAPAAVRSPSSQPVHPSFRLRRSPLSPILHRRPPEEPVAVEDLVKAGPHRKSGHTIVAAPSGWYAGSSHAADATRLTPPSPARPVRGLVACTDRVSVAGGQRDGHARGDEGDPRWVTCRNRCRAPPHGRGGRAGSSEMVAASGINAMNGIHRPRLVPSGGRAPRWFHPGGGPGSRAAARSRGLAGPSRPPS
jgi:hypothetical protein